MTTEKIDLQYILISKMIADEMTKTLTYIKFYLLVKQIYMS